MIRQQEEAPGAWQKLRYKHQKAARNIGFAMVISFVLIPVLFVLLYVRADHLNYEDPPGDASHGAAGDFDYFDEEPGFPDINLPVEFETPDYDESGIENGDDEPLEPAVPIIGTAYLTFDDGPSRTLTPGILDILKEEGIVATFFVLPREGANDIFQRILDEGHEIGNHSYSHNYEQLYRGRVSAFREDVLKARRFIEEHFGYSSTSFRFPGGSMTWNRDVRNPRIDTLKELGYRYFDWHIDSGDAHPEQRDKGVEAITENVLSSTGGREHVIILLHDFYGRETTLEALPAIITGLKQQGYVFDIIRNMP